VVDFNPENGLNICLNFSITWGLNPRLGNFDASFNPFNLFNYSMRID
jgi:hypothetical protein